MANIKAIVGSLIGIIILIIVIMSFYDSAGDTLLGSGNALANTSVNASQSRIPLNSLFSGTGVVVLIASAGVLLTIIGGALYWFKRGR